MDHSPLTTNIGLPDLHTYLISISNLVTQDRFWLVIGGEALSDHWKEEQNDIL